MSRPTDAPRTWVEFLCPVCGTSAWGDPEARYYCVRHPKARSRSQAGKFQAMRPIGAASARWKRATA